MLALPLPPDRCDPTANHRRAWADGSYLPYRREKAALGLARYGASAAGDEADRDVSPGIPAARSESEEACLGGFADCYEGVGVDAASAEVNDAPTAPAGLQ